MSRGGIDAIAVSGVDMRIVFVLFAGWVVGDVKKLVAKVVCVSDAMVVVSAVPNFSRGLIADGKGVSALDELNAFCS